MVTDPELSVHHSLGVDTSADRITQVLGKPDQMKDDVCYQSVDFKIVDGRIKAIEWISRLD